MASGEVEEWFEPGVEETEESEEFEEFEEPQYCSIGGAASIETVVDIMLENSSSPNHDSVSSASSNPRGIGYDSAPVARGVVGRHATHSLFCATLWQCLLNSRQLKLADDGTAWRMRFDHHVRPFFGNDYSYRWPKWAPAHGQQLRPQMSSTCISGLYHLEK